MKTHLVLSVVITALAATACSGQKSTAYEGEPLARLSGNVVLAKGAAPVEAKVVVAWSNFTVKGDAYELMEAPIQGQFPSKFTLDLLTPPVDAAFNDFTKAGMYPKETRVAVGPIGALRAGHAAKPVSEDVLGVVQDYVVVYVERDVLPDTTAAAFLHAPLGRGYHLMRVQRRTAAEKATREAERQACIAALPAAAEGPPEVAKCGSSASFDELHPAEGGFDTEVTLELAPAEQLDFPNFT